MIFNSFSSIFVGLIFMVLGVICLKFPSEDNKIRELQKIISKICTVITSICITWALINPVMLPQYKVWQQNKEGEAEPARAEQNRKIAIQEAKAKEEAARSLANAEIIRAEGIAQANKIIGDSLQNNDAYIHYLWIEALRESKNDVIYIPTEAGIPITESSRFFKNRKVD